MRKNMLSALGLVALLVTAASAQNVAAPTQVALAPASAIAAAPGVKPVLVVTFSGYDRLHEDLEFIGQLSNQPELANSLDGIVALVTKFQGPVGLDKRRPWGVAVSTDGVELQNLGFLPVTDVKKLLALFADSIGNPEELDDSILKISANGAPVFIKQDKGWAFIAMSREELANLPADPKAIFGTLTTDYDIGIRANVQNVPEDYRNKAIAEIQRGMQSGMERNDDETDEQYEARVKMMQQQVDRLIQMFKELNELTIGWAIDGKKRSAYLDVTMTAVPGTKLAQSAAQTTIVPSRFGGFLIPAAMANANFAYKEPQDEIENGMAMLKSLRTTLSSGIDDSDDLQTPEEKVKVKGLMNQVMDVVEATFKKGVMDGGAVIDGEGPFTIAGGLGVDGGDKLEAAFKESLSMTKGKDAPAIQLNVANHKGVNFHSLKGPWPESEDDDPEQTEQMKAFLGDELELTAGFSKDSVYIAIGPEGVSTIKKVIDGSAASAKPTVPFQLNIALSPIVNFAAEQDENNPVLGIAADSLEGGKDKVHITSQVIPNGAMMRMEFEEGVLKVIGVMIQAAQAGIGR